LERAGTDLRIKNFSHDIKDSQAYTYLLTQIAPPEAHADLEPLSQSDLEQRAEMVLTTADKFNCRKFVSPKDIVKGNPKLNLAFVAHLFNTRPCLEGQENPEWNLDDIEGETREEKTYRNWMNSMGVNPFINSLYNDMKSGYVILQLIDKIKPGIVDWSRVTRPPFKPIQAHMKSIENCNYAVELAKQLNMSVVGTQGSNIYDGDKVYVLGLLWQLLRAYTVKVLQDISGSEKPISDAEIVDFINSRLTEHKHQTIASFKDQYIGTSLPIFHIIDSIRPGTVNYDLVIAEPASDEDKLANAKLVISLARKVGAGVYALPEDIVEVKPKMVFTIFVCL
jgi:hypothetical protein